MDGMVLGRDEILDTIGRLVFGGETVLLHGSLGIGKTTMLGELARRAAQAGRPCAFCPRTERLSDITEALVRGYSIGTGALTQRRRRSRVRLVIERQPGILLLDHLFDVGNGVKGYLRSLGGTGLGVVIAVDVEPPRDHARVRARGLIGWLADLLRSRASVRRSVEREVGEYLERIVQANASRIQGDFRERVRESRWRMQAEIRALFQNISASAERALGRARERRAAGAEAIQIELSRIKRLHFETEALMPPSRMEPMP